MIWNGPKPTQSWRLFCLTGNNRCLIKIMFDLVLVFLSGAIKLISIIIIRVLTPNTFKIVPLYYQGSNPERLEPF